MADSNPQNPAEPREPTLKELLAIMHADELSFWKSGSGSPQQREEFLEGIRARWRALQKPATPPPNPEPPESNPDDKTPNRTIPFANPTEEYLRQDRITQAIQSGGRPDPEDLAEEEADKIRYQRKLAEAFEKKRKELLSPESPPPKDTSEKTKPGAKADPKPKGGEHPEPWAGVMPPKSPLIVTGRQPKQSHPPLVSFFLSAAFALVAALVISALQIAGVISMGLAHMHDRTFPVGRGNPLK